MSKKPVRKKIRPGFSAGSGHAVRLSRTTWLLGGVRDAGTAKAILAVIRERQRQVDEEGWSFEHDDDVNGQGDLAKAALCYLDVVRQQGSEPRKMPEAWPWSRDWWKPCFGDPRYSDESSAIRRETEKAAAMLVAERERLSRSHGSYAWIGDAVVKARSLSARGRAPRLDDGRAWQERACELIRGIHLSEDRALAAEAAAASAVIALAAMNEDNR